MKKPSPLHWETHEYDHRSKSSDWFWAVGILTIAISVTAIIFNNILFAIVVILSGFSLLIYSARPPKKIDVVINEKGLLVDNFFYPFYTLESFWIEDHTEPAKVLIKSQKLLMPFIIVSIEEVPPEKVKRYLSRYLPEVFHSESIFHRFFEYLGF